MECQRCGTCCEKGGPALHQEDRRLVESGQIPAGCLFTIRRGERVRDNVRGTLAAMSGEVIKIKGQGGRWTCRFYDGDQRACGIYNHRPLECRVLNCRDTQQIEAVYARGRLIRKDLLVQMEGLWDVIIDHDTRCGYDQLGDLIRKGVNAGQLAMEAEILEILRYDAHLRQLTVDTGGMDAGMLDFIFGRPLAQTIGTFDLRLVKDRDRYRLVPSATFFSTPQGDSSVRDGG